MDELDRMYRRLVQNLRAGFPDLLARPFEVSELYTTLVPYRHNRRELGLETKRELAPEPYPESGSKPTKVGGDRS